MEPYHLKADEYTIKQKLSTYIDIITDIRKKNQILEINEENETSLVHLFFRGQRNLDWQISASIYRLNQSSFKSTRSELEHYLTQEIERLYPDDFENIQTNFGKLTKMQHYGLFTRLIDMTQNPLVALYFACQSPNNAYEKDSDGVVYIFRQIPKRCGNQEHEKEIEQYCKRELIDEIPKNDDSIFVLPRHNNSRIRAQQGAFAICHTPTSLQQFEYVDVEKNIPLRIRIPASRKKEILSDLSFIGITGAALFPELDKATQVVVDQITEHLSSTASIGSSVDF